MALGKGGVIGWTLAVAFVCSASLGADVPTISDEGRKAQARQVVVDTDDAWSVFRTLAEMNSIRVTALGHRWTGWPRMRLAFFMRGPGEFMSVRPRRDLLVPHQLCGRPVQARDLLEGIAKAADLKIAWLDGGTHAVIYEGEPDEVVDRLRTDLKSADAAKRAEAAWKAGFLSDPRVVPLLEAAMGDADQDVSEAAVLAFERMNWGGALPFVGQQGWTAAGRRFRQASLQVATNMLQHWAGEIDIIGGVRGKEIVRKDIAETYRELRKYYTFKQAYDIFAALLRAGDTDVVAKALDNGRDRFDASCALGCVEGPRVRDMLEMALSDKPGAKDALLQEPATAKSGMDRVLARLGELLANDDEDAFSGAMVAMALLGDERTAAMMERLAHHPQAYVRRKAVLYAGRVHGEKSLKLLTEAAGDVDWRTRCNAINELAAVGGDGILPTMEKSLKDPEAEVRWAAITSLGVWRGEKALSLLAEALKSNDRATCCNAIWALGHRLDDPKAVDLLKTVLVHEDHEYRFFAARGLGERGGEEIMAFLENALQDPDGDVRLKRSATIALGFIRHPKALPLLEKAAASPDDEQRLQAVYAAGWVGGAEGAAILEKALSDRYMKCRTNGLCVWGLVGWERAVPAMARSMEGAGEQWRLSLACCLGVIGTSRAREALQRQAQATPEKDLQTVLHILTDRVPASTPRQRLWAYVGLEMFRPSEPERRKPPAVAQLTPPPSTPAPAPMTKQDALAKAAKAGKVLWSKDDTAAQGLTWIAVEKKFVSLFNSADGTLAGQEEFIRLVGKTDVTVTGLAFGAETVWAGTDRGAFAYDRRTRAWNQLVINMDMALIDAEVEKVAMTETGVSFTVKGKGSFEYDPKTRKWRKM